MTRTCRRFLSLLALLFGAVLLALPALAGNGNAGTAPRVHVVPVTGTIGPATHDLIKREIRAAENSHAALLILQLDTPGGLYDSTQHIVQSILDSRVPVATLVAPDGAHAASAGTYILYASHLAAMAPSTRLGSATPIAMGDGKEGETGKAAPSTLERKVVNDAAAFIRSLAKRHGRNAAWAERAVRAADSLTASEAVAKKVVELLAATPQDLAARAHGRRITMADGRTTTLDTRNADIVLREPGLRHRVLEALTHPNIALLLMTLGTYGVIYEFASPGALIPGVTGAIFLLLGLYAMNVLSVNLSGLALLLLGLALMTAEAFTVSFGILGLGGAAAFVCGALLLMKPDVLGGMTVDPWLVAALAVSSLAVLSVSLGMVITSLRRRKVTGQEEILSATAEVTQWQGERGEVLLTGEIWQARCPAPHVLRAGERVRVVALDGLTVTVVPLSTITPPQGE